MSYFSDAHRFRKTIAGLCMIGAPALFLIASLTTPGVAADEGAQVGLIAGDPDAWVTSEILLLAAWGLFIPAVMGLMHMLRERGAAEGNLGGALAITGTAAAIAQVGFGLALWQVAKTDVAQATTMLTGFADSTIPALVLFALPLGVTVGAVVLTWALYRHHLAPTWTAAVIGASAILFAVASINSTQELFIASSAALLVGLGALGLRVLGEPVEDWEHTPVLG